MDNLRELTIENHRKAERSKFMDRLVRRKLTEYEYYLYLSNQFCMYYMLETFASRHYIFCGIDDVKRSCRMGRDLAELELEHGFKQIMPTHATQKYLDYLETISNDKDKLLAHVYVRHMGDLSGGQIIKKFVPGTGRAYKFDEDVDVLKEKMRKKLSDDLAEEANRCFDMVYDQLEELENYFEAMEQVR